MGCDKDLQSAKSRIELFQSTQPEWAATQRYSDLFDSIQISIHAARVGCDTNVQRLFYLQKDFNPRSPSGLRPLGFVINSDQLLFQSTQPEWAATLADSTLMGMTKNFNPRSPSGLRPLTTTAPNFDYIFQSTQPEWAAT